MANGTIKRETATGGQSIDTLEISYFGKVVTINGYLGNLELLPGTELEVGILNPGIPKPKGMVRVRCGVGNNAWSTQYDGILFVTTNGEISVRHDTPNKTFSTVYVSCSYISY